MIRIANKNDLNRISTLLYQVHDVHHKARPDLFKGGIKKYSDEELLKLYNNSNYHIFVALEENMVVGYAICIDEELQTGKKSIYIDDLCVDQAYRNKGIGRNIYNYVVQYAKENGYYNLTLNSYYDNKKAYEFYKSLGMSIQKVYFETILE